MIYTGYFHWLWFYVFFMLLFSYRCCFLFILFYWNITSLLFHPDNSINKNAHLNMKKKPAIKKVSFYYFHIIITISFNVCCHKSSDMVAYFFSFIVENWTTNLAFGFFFQFYICSRLKKRFSLYLACSKCKEETANIELKNPNRAETKKQRFRICHMQLIIAVQRRREFGLV